MVRPCRAIPSERRAGFAVHPAGQRLQPTFVGGVGEQVDDLGDAPLRFPHVTVHHVSVDAIAAPQEGDRIAHVRRLHVFPVQVSRVAPHCEAEAAGQPFP